MGNVGAERCTAGCHAGTPRGVLCRRRHGSFRKAAFETRYCIAQRMACKRDSGCGVLPRTDIAGDERVPEHFRENIGPGCYGDTVGLLGAGTISQKLQELLTNFELNVIVMASRPERRTVSMEEVFRKAFVVSNHLPNRIDNQNVIREEHFLSMRKGAAFINTGRGAQVDEEGMTAALKKRPDLTALPDVAATEPLRADSELYRMPNVRLSGHIAGSFNDEVIRMADYVIGDFRRMRNGETPLHRISEEMLMTH